MILALVLRLHGLLNASLWLDEGYTLVFSRLPIKQVILVGGAHEHPPLYYLISHVLLSIRADNMIPRFISVVAGTLSVAAIAWLGALLVNRQTGLLAAALLAVSPMHIWFSQNGRSYALAGLFILLSYGSGIAAIKTGNIRWQAAYTLCLALCVYTDYMSAIMLAPQLLVLLWTPPSTKRILMRSWLVAGVVFLPWLATLLLDLKTVAANYWVPLPTLNSVQVTFAQFLGMAVPCPSPPCRVTEGPYPFFWGIVGLVLITALAAIALAGAYGITHHNRLVVLLVTWAMFPFVFVLTLALRRSLYLDRVFLGCIFPLLLLLAAAAFQLPYPRLRVVARWCVGAVLAVAGLTTARASGSHGQIDWATPSRDLTTMYRPGQAVIYYPGPAETIVRTYTPPSFRPSFEQPIWFKTYLDVPGWQARYAGKSDLQILDAQLSNATQGRNSAWLVAQGYTNLPFARKWFIAHNFERTVSKTYVGKTRLELYTRRTGLAPSIG